MNPNMAEYIMLILKSRLSILFSWGPKGFTAIQDGLIFHVQGYKFNGWVKVVYDEGADLFNVHYLTNKMKEVKEQQGIYFDMLVETIDNTVDKCANYEQKVRQQYTLV